MADTSDAIHDQLLLLRSQRGDTAALNELISRWEKRLFYYIRRLIDEEQDTWDVLQQTWMKAVKSLRGLRDPRAFPTWIYRIARNTSFDHRRSMQGQPVALDNEASLESIEDQEPEFRAEDAERVHYLLARLSLAHREVLTLHFLEDLSLADIAEIVGVPMGTVKSRLHHARRCLRSVLGRED